MSWIVEISLKNEDNEVRSLTIPKGHVFENKRIGTGVQNVAAARDYTFVLSPKSVLKIDIEVLCINQRLSSPSGSYNMTCFKINKPFVNQDDLWSVMQP